MTPAPLTRGATSAGGGAQGWLADLCSGLQGALAPHADGGRALIAATLVVQCALAATAALTAIYYYADGSFFLYAIITGDPWGVKWSFIGMRWTTYVLAVVPTDWIWRALPLTGDQLAAVNGFIFYIIPAIQTALIAALAWNRAPALLLFPVAHYITGSGLGFGFPTEAHLAPGFFWLAMICLAVRPRWWWVWGPSIVGLAGSHELAIPSVLLIGLFALAKPLLDPQRRVGDVVIGAAAATLAVVCVAVVVIIFVRLKTAGVLGAGVGGDELGLFQMLWEVFAPSQHLYARTLWVLAPALAVTAVVALALRRAFTARETAIAAVIVAALTLALAPVLNFEAGRYGSARTMLVVAMPVIGLVFALATMGGRASGIEERPFWRWLSAAAPASLAVGLAVIVSASLGFAYFDWSQMRRGYDAILTPAAPGAAPIFITEDEARLRIPAASRAAPMRHSDYFGWTLPLRSVVMADAFRPATIVYAPESIASYCPGDPSVPYTLASFGGAVDRATMQALRDFACATRTAGQSAAP